ncbi:MAG: hypothetical protein WBQ66_05715, partial [Blastocatellia bacterium]
AEARAFALAGRAATELASGDAAAAVATTSEALRLASESPMTTDETLPALAEITIRRAAIEALTVRAAALEKLGKAGPAYSARALAASIAPNF